jgi:hypothetical protein
MQTHALALAIEASKSFARRRFRLSQARVRFDDPSVTRSNKRARSDGSLWRKMLLFGAAVADAGDRRGMVEGIRKHHHDYQFASSGTSTPRPFWKVAGPPPSDAIKTSPGRNGIECAAGADVVGRLLDGVGEPARAHQRLAPIENSGPTAIKAQPAPRIGLDLIAARLAAAGRS